MPTGRRTRTACQSCHIHGQFRPIEVLLPRTGRMEWNTITLCAPCRHHLESWAQAEAERRHQVVAGSRR